MGTIKTVHRWKVMIHWLSSFLHKGTRSTFITSASIYNRKCFTIHPNIVLSETRRLKTCAEMFKGKMPCAVLTVG